MRTPPSRSLLRSFLLPVLMIGLLPGAGPQNPNDDQADLLLKTAAQHEQAGEWLLAALAYESSARLRSRSDSRRPAGFVAAARSYYAGRYLEEAAGMSLEGGEAAVIQGDPMLAASSFGNAASLYREIGKKSLAQALALRSCQALASSQIRRQDQVRLARTLGCRA